VLRFPIEFFSASAIQEPTADDASFRSLASMTAGQRDAALSAGALAFELMAWIASRFRLPEPAIPDLSELGHPELAAEDLRPRWKLGDTPISNMVHLLEQHGCRVFSLAETARSVDAFSLWREGTPYVFLNTTKSAEHARMDAAHELGHLVLHRTRATRDSSDEDEAQAFAAAFLMPRSRLLATVPRAPTLAALLPHKRHWGVSLAGFVYRVHRVGALTEWQYRTLFIELSKRGYRTREPNELPRETSQVLRKVFEYLRARGQTLRDVAHELQLAQTDLETLVFGLTLVSVGGGGEGGGRPKSRPRSV
jgi:Zn-dependent peptidase ImmA (M78 family)